MQRRRVKQRTRRLRNPMRLAINDRLGEHLFARERHRACFGRTREFGIGEQRRRELRERRNVNGRCSV
jgi:hypothetical protein